MTIETSKMPRNDARYRGKKEKIDIESTLDALCTHSWLLELIHLMRKHTNDRLQGTLDLLVLKTLTSRGRLHGYAITLHIEQVSEDILRLEEGSLYPALHRMTQSGWLRSEWGLSENNRRARYYSITATGRKQLTEEENNWAALTGAVSRVLQFS
jgi:PadR family transcriptional regulator PadR